MSEGQNYLLKIFQDAFKKTRAYVNGEKTEEEHEPTIEDRAVSMDEVWWQSQMQAWEIDDWSSVINIFTDDANSIYAVIASNGLLYRADVEVMDDVATLSKDWVEVIKKTQFDPVPESSEDRSKYIVRQQEDGRYRWLSVSCTAVLNRSGSIDSRKLFDSFVEKIDSGEAEYPNRYFYHIVDDKFKTGKCDFVARDGFLLITSGLYDDLEENPLAKAEVESRIAEPEYWGESIGFLAAQPEMYEVTDGIELPVFNDGILMEISNLPEAQAASWFTNFTNVKMEVNRMALKPNEKEALDKLMGESDADEFLSETDSINRDIGDSNMIKREMEITDEEVEVEEVETEVTAEQEPETEEELPADDPVEEDQEPEQEPEDQEVIEAETDDGEFELDDELFNEITESVAEKLRTENEELKERVAELESVLLAAIEDFEEVKILNEKRLKSLEAEDDQKKQEWIADLPRKNRRVISRKRSGETVVQEDEKISSEELAQKSLAAFPESK